jgi:hypothetical protein
MPDAGFVALLERSETRPADSDGARRGHGGSGKRRKPSPPSERPRHRRWPWVLGAVVLLLGGGAIVVWLTTSRAVPVSIAQAEGRLGTNDSIGSLGNRPAPGVYRFTGSGTDRLSLPPLSQPEGPTMPGTVSLVGSDCWTFRIDYSSHHWQTWDFCDRGGTLVETGGAVWQLWSIGPINVTNMTTLRCTRTSTWIPSHLVAGSSWRTSCGGTSTAVHGPMTTAGSDRYVRTVTMKIGGRPVAAEYFRQVRKDSGAQRGTEVSSVWLEEGNGLPLRLTENIEVVTGTPFGTSTYRQQGVFQLKSLSPLR